MEVLNLNPTDDIAKEINSLTAPATVYLASGIYRQKTLITANDIHIIGEAGTVITYDDYARKIHADGKEYNTFRTYTLCITGERVTLENITIENSNTNPSAVGQCVALSVHARSFYAKNVDLKSTQDTLFLSPFPDDLVVRYRNFIPDGQLYREGHNLHLFENCRIYGTVDFIFGCSEAYFKNCKIISIADARGIGFAAAPAHPLAEKYGFSFIDCGFISEGAKENSCFLARPWRDFGKCVFINCSLDKHLKPELFDKWNDTERDKTARFLYYNLKCGFKPIPVNWAKELSTDQAEEIIARCKQCFNTIKQ